MMCPSCPSTIPRYRYGAGAGWWCIACGKTESAWTAFCRRAAELVMLADALEIAELGRLARSVEAPRALDATRRAS